jgi:hypothetical protein
LARTRDWCRGGMKLSQRPARSRHN